MKKVSTILFIIVVVGIIGLLNWYAAPTMSDDVMYRFIWQDRTWNNPYEPIQNISDVITSQLNHYQYINGRSMTHSMAQIALNLIPEKIAKLLNTAMFLLLVFLTTLYISKDKKKQTVVAAFVFGFLFFVISGFGTGFIWLLGSFIYLWALVITMCFLFMLHKLRDCTMSWKLVPLIPLTFFMGWTHEAIAIPLSLALIVYLLTHRKGMFNQAVTYFTIAYTLGMLMIVLSPALWWRTDVGGIPLTQRVFSGIVNLIFGLRISWILLVTLVIIFYKNKDNFKKYIRQYQYLLIAWIVAMGIVFSCGTSIERVPICADFLATLIVLSIWQNYPLEKYHTAIITTICLLSIVVSVPAVSLSYQNYQNYLYHCSQLEQPDSQLIKVRQLPADMNGFTKYIAKRYTNPTIEYSFYNCYMAFDQHDLNNRAVAALYDKERVVFLPEDVIRRIENDSLAYCKMESDEHHNLYILQLNPQQEVNHLTFILGEEVPLKFYQRYSSYPEDKYELDSFNYEVVNVQDKKYLVMTIPTPNIARRINDIYIE